MHPSRWPSWYRARVGQALAYAMIFAGAAGLAAGIWAHRDVAVSRYPRHWIGIALPGLATWLSLLCTEKDRVRLQRWTGIPANVWAVVGPLLMAVCVVYPQHSPSLRGGVSA